MILPLSLPGILVGYTLNFIAIWKEFVFGLVFLNSEDNFPVTVGMLKLNSDRYLAVFNLPAAGLVISQLPIVIAVHPDLPADLGRQSLGRREGLISRSICNKEFVMAEVSLKDIEKRYAVVPVLSGLNLDIADGEFTVLVGPSGCGKTTTLNMIAGLESITGGTLRIGARDVTTLPPKDRDIAMVFQSYALFPHMTVRDNIAFGMKIRKTPKADIETQIRQVAQRLRIDDLLDRLPKALSGGQRQRVALGRALVRRPGVFLMDEPLSNLDAKMRIEARSFLTKMHQEIGTTTVYVTHDQAEAMTMGSKIVVMNGGKIQQAAAPLEVYNRPANQFVAGFIGSPAMNFLRLVCDGNSIADQACGLRIVVPEKPGRHLPARTERWSRWEFGRNISGYCRPERSQGSIQSPSMSMWSSISVTRSYSTSALAITDASRDCRPATVRRLGKAGCFQSIWTTSTISTATAAPT